MVPCEVVPPLMRFLAPHTLEHHPLICVPPALVRLQVALGGTYVGALGTRKSGGSCRSGNFCGRTVFLCISRRSRPGFWPGFGGRDVLTLVHGCFLGANGNGGLVRLRGV